VIEIRSFRRVFDLERRIYSVDRLRLNPAGVPVRGIVYLLALVSTAVLAAALPVLGAPLRLIPWYLRDLAIPAGIATVLAVIRVDGRAFHLGARARIGWAIGPRSVSGLSRPSTVGQRWLPHDLLVLPDGSEARMRRFRYTGPGAVLVLIAHRRRGAAERGGVGFADRRRALRLEPAAGRRRGPGTVIALEPGARLLLGSSAPRNSR
jgi:hypothetical protein